MAILPIKSAPVSILVIFIAAFAPARAQDLDATLDSSRWDGLSIKYPGDLFTIFRPVDDPKPEDDPNKDAEIPGAADRDVLKSNDGAAEVILGGDYNSSDYRDANAYLDRFLERDKQQHPSAIVTYRAARDDWAVASGTFDNRIFYYKFVAHCENDARSCNLPETFATAQFDYAADQHDLYDKLVVEMSQTLTPAIPPD
ncbi:MAG TPA: hypothetical protein VEJ16_12150 [Alphaproteobacteria bacterium]|nr:hypothetical protein [Alphaproteobacteria bacterium]